MDSFDLLPTLAAGELEQTSAAELVAAIFRSRASGTLSIEGEGGVEIRQFFRAGDMCGSSFFAGFRTLAQVLLANDWVAALDIDASRAEAQATGLRHGQVLVDKRLLTADQLKQALYTQHRQNLAALLQLERGHYELRGWEPPPAWSRELSIDPVSVLVDALETERLVPRRQRVVAWLGDHAARLSVDWPEISARVQLEPADRRAAALLALPRRPAEFVQLSRLSEGRGEGLLVALLLTGAAEAHPAAQASFPQDAREGSAQRTASLQPSSPAPTYVPSTAPPERADSGPHAAISEPTLVAQDGAPGEASELVPLEAEPPPTPKRQTRPPSVRSAPPPPGAPPTSSGPRPRVSPGMPLFSRPLTMPPKPAPNTGYRLPQPSQPPPGSSPSSPTNSGYRVDSRPPSRPLPPPEAAAPPASAPPAQPTRPVRKVPESLRPVTRPVPPAAGAPQPETADQPGFGQQQAPAGPAYAPQFPERPGYGQLQEPSEPGRAQPQYATAPPDSAEPQQAQFADPFAADAPIFSTDPVAAPLLPGQPSSRRFAPPATRTVPPSARSLSPAQSQRLQQPPEPPAAPPPPPEQDAFARLEAFEKQANAREQQAASAAQAAAQELPGGSDIDHSGGLRRSPGGGFEFNGQPSDLVQMDVHKSRPAAAPNIPPPDDSAAALRKKMRAQGLRNLTGAAPQGSAHAPPQPEYDLGATAPDAKPVVDESALSFEDRRFIDDVRTRIRTIGDQDAWARLGVTRNATSDQIRAAYLEAAKRYHPDHAAAPAFAGIQDELRSLFQSVKDAYDLIATAPAREAYLSGLKQGTSGKVRDRKEEAALALKMGEALLKKRDFAAAMVKLRRSVELDANGDSLAALGWGLMCDPATSPAGKEEAATLLSKALRAHGLSARTYYVAGVLWRTKDPDSAADAFRKALELEPNHADASLELRLLEMRQGKKSSGGGVLSTLLFGKKR